MFARIVRAIDAGPILFHLVNASVATIFVVFAWRSWNYFQGLRESGGDGIRIATAVLSITNCGILVASFLLRRRSKEVGADVTSVLLGHLGTWTSLLTVVFPGERPFSSTLVEPCLWIMAAACALQLLAFLSLGRSWGIVPANRGVKRGGLYRLVRHPIYAIYTVFYINLAILSFNWASLLVAVVLPPLLFARATLEERVLRRDPEYVTYAEGTRYMFFPGVI
jgi:protein-S-isoprenylcysteine O-methyltransferase Ste14